MPADPISTLFAPAERATATNLRRQVGYFSETSLTKNILDAIPSLLLILNEQRQIVYANNVLLKLVAAGRVGQAHGMRPGELLDCVHARKSEGGCGTTEECSACGMVLATLESLNGEKAVRECRFTRRREGQRESLDLKVRTTPLNYAGEVFTVFAVSDISHEKRRQALEKIFFHDILNLIGSIKGFAELLQTDNSTDRERIFDLMQSAAERTIEEIEAQRALAAAENGELRLRPEPVSVGDFLEKVVGIYRRHEVAEGRTLLLAPILRELVLTTDNALLGRVLGNMIKNALEATARGETVTVSCRRSGGRAEFTVHNPGVMSREAKLQVFQRSFSTKGPGRGLGTYSMHLLSGYLGGKVTFTSTPSEGTTFCASYPLTLSTD